MMLLFETTTFGFLYRRNGFFAPASHARRSRAGIKLPRGAMWYRCSPVYQPRNHGVGMDGEDGNGGCGCRCGTATFGSLCARTVFPAMRTTRVGPGAQGAHVAPVPPGWPGWTSPLVRRATASASRGA